ncbi:response regulator transcription factor [Ohessyouella blattaphilus]|uniref:Stage 0 sporulation protein A homolog n=1 Tax=Ohessyouella blattaphilus TaxID=2949333 RepID=A0ABT1EIK9_9FIRM|nr:response regulator [Ohessyouella blattaphilus]MCP1110518.1 response regulator [Ohessyouella blattaphilus]MCR8563912.1 response regulator [Ohessyouella blattaphilus]
MLKLVIVDDEPLATEYLTELIIWEDFGFQLVGKANSARQAISIIKKNKVDLVITDIQMPGNDGIKLIEMARELELETKFILLSAYSEFEYAKSALSLGVLDYLLKQELSKDYLESKMSSVYMELSKEVFKKQQSETHLIKDCFLGSVYTETDRRGIELPKRDMFFYMIIPRICFFSSLHKQEINNRFIEMKKANDNFIQSIEKEKYQDFLVDYSFELPNSSVVLLINENRPVSAFQKKAWAEEVRREIEEQYKTFGGYYVIYGEQKDIAQKWGLVYQEFARDMNSLIFYKGDRFISLDKWNAYIKKVHGERVRYENIQNKLEDIKWIQELGNYTKESVVDKIKGEWESIERCKNNQSPLNALIKLLEIAKSKNRTAFEELRLDEKWFEEYSNDSYIMMELYTEIALKTVAAKRKGKENTYSKDVSMAIRYINLHFCDKYLAVEKIAKKVELSISRLSVVFKKETGMTIGGFITNKRIEAAKRYLQERELRVHEIAELVGYSSSQYFSQVFLNEVGMSPKEYANMEGN